MAERVDPELEETWRARVQPPQNFTSHTPQPPIGTGRPGTVGQLPVAPASVPDYVVPIGVVVAGAYIMFQYPDNAIFRAAGLGVIAYGAHGLLTAK